jgi:hypothetical protein
MNVEEAEWGQLSLAREMPRLCLRTRHCDILLLLRQIQGCSIDNTVIAMHTHDASAGSCRLPPAYPVVWCSWARSRWDDVTHIGHAADDETLEIEPFLCFVSVVSRCHDVTA